MLPMVNLIQEQVTGLQKTHQILMTMQNEQWSNIKNWAI